MRHVLSIASFGFTLHLADVGLSAWAVQRGFAEQARAYQAGGWPAVIFCGLLTYMVLVAYAVWARRSLGRMALIAPGVVSLSQFIPLIHNVALLLNEG
jgi:hypothetical protein